jgi:hypothetical protein
VEKGKILKEMNTPGRANLLKYEIIDILDL